MNARRLVLGGLGTLVAMVIVLVVVVVGRGSETGPATAPGAMTLPGTTPAAVDGVAEVPEAKFESGEPRARAGVESAAAPVASRPAPDPTSATASPATPAPAPGALDAPAPAPAPAQGAAGQQPAVEEILRATARRYEGVRALQADFRQELHNPLLGTRTQSRGTLYQRQPDRFLMRFSQPAGDVIVSDGDFFWLYFPSSDPRQVLRSRRGAQGLDLRSQFVGDPVRRFQATYHGREAVAGRDTHVITLVPREPLGYRRLKAWIDTADHLVRRFELTEESEIVRRLDLGDLRINVSLPDSLFEFSPPPGAHVVDRG